MQSHVMNSTSVSLAEAESLIDALHKFTLHEYGSAAWFRQLEILIRLNIQAHFSAVRQEEEYIPDLVLTKDVFHILIHELVCAEIFRNRVWPHARDEAAALENSFRPYFLLYYETLVANFIEVSLTAEDEIIVENGENLIDLIDWCAHLLPFLEGEHGDGAGKEGDLLFCSAVSALSILRAVFQVVHRLPISAAARAVRTHDVPSALAALLTQPRPPWVRERGAGVAEFFEDGEWRRFASAAERRFRITKVPGQMWLTLFCAFAAPEAARLFELNAERAAALERLAHRITETAIDQVPCLADLRAAIERALVAFSQGQQQGVALPSVALPAAVGGALPVEVRRDAAALVRTNLVDVEAPVRAHLARGAQEWARRRGLDAARAGGVYALLAREVVLPMLRAETPERIREDTRRLSELFGDGLDELLASRPVCARCGADAASRCGRCKATWYCSRRCQAKHWKQHKPACDKTAEALAAQARANDIRLTAAAPAQIAESAAVAPAPAPAFDIDGID
eukprot:gnl/Chilomastix_cuspidata/2332.p1 GENE.gnl/Chilomastix_cuspidata/2332~~gnl/Chilomastix_cuspidata/2332.p1  ORF type:complete len:513 (+),score=187.38 gnl/Chilomastix_cuspidata/2332:18-1556(+)